MDTDRRQFKRVKLDRNAKLFDPRCKKFRPAKTIDASCGGLLLEVHRNANLQPGDTINIAIDWDQNNSTLTQKQQMIPLRVLRSHPKTYFTVELATEFAINQDAIPNTQLAA